MYFVNLAYHISIVPWLDPTKTKK